MLAIAIIFYNVEESKIKKFIYVCETKNSPEDYFPIN